MTTAPIVLRTRLPRTLRSSSTLNAVRLLGLELRRNAMISLLPLLAAMFWFDAYRTAMSYPAVWELRASVISDHLVLDWAPFVAGVSAWTGSRARRRRITGLLATTPKLAWARLSATLAAVTSWVIAAYLACVAVLYAITAHWATWGGPPLWPVAVGAAALAAACAIGFAGGTFLASRFTAWLAALFVFLLELTGFRLAVGAPGGYSVLSVPASVPNQDAGIFYPYLPDLALAQTMFLAGLAVAALGALGLADGARLRAATAVTCMAGLAAAGTAVGLAGTARLGPDGAVIGALHDAASDRPIPYTPVCAETVGVPVCVHPAFRTYLPQVTAALQPVLRQVASLPGAPAKVSEVDTGLVADTGQQATLKSNPPVYSFAMPPTPGSFVQVAGEDFAESLRISFIATFIGGSASTSDPAQQTVETVLLRQVAPEPTYDMLGQPADPAALAAVSRFAALPPGARHAWLAAHLTALRAGRITLGELP